MIFAIAVKLLPDDSKKFKKVLFKVGTFYNSTIDVGLGSEV